MVRDGLGVVAGLLVWMFGFLVLAIALAQCWPAYAVHGREWTAQGVFTFTAAMATSNLVLWVLSEIGAGWIAGKIAKHRAALWVFAGLVGIYFIMLHFVLYWSRFPGWYNLGVVIPSVPAVLLGGNLAMNKIVPAH